jgi:hypothetical protein
MVARQGEERRGRKHRVYNAAEQKKQNRGCNRLYAVSVSKVTSFYCKGTSDTHKSWGRSKDIYQLYINTGSRLTWGRSKEKEVKDQTQVKQLFK